MDDSNKQELRRQSDAFYQAAMLAALNGLCANPAHTHIEPIVMVKKAESLAEIAEYRFKKVFQGA